MKNSQGQTPTPIEDQASQKKASIFERIYFLLRFVLKKEKGGEYNPQLVWGQTLVELMIAMSVMSIGLLGVFAVLSQSLGLNRVVADQYVAANLAAEGIEVVKNIVDSNVVRCGDAWNVRLSTNKLAKFGIQHDSDPGCNENLEILNGDWANKNIYFNPKTGIYSYDTGGMRTNFVRTITINHVSTDEIQVNSTVMWSGRGGIDFEVVLEDRFFDWRQ